MSLKISNYNNNIPPSPSRLIKLSFPKWFPHPNSFDFSYLTEHRRNADSTLFSYLEVPPVCISAWWLVARDIPYGSISQTSDIAIR